MTTEQIQLLEAVANEIITLRAIRSEFQSNPPRPNVYDMSNAQMTVNKQIDNVVTAFQAFEQSAE